MASPHHKVVIGSVSLRQATAADAETIHALIVNAARWMAANDIGDWLPTEFLVTDVLAWAEAGDTYVATSDAGVVGAVRIQRSDSLWERQRPDARYIHKLVIDRRFAGQRVGRAILAAAEECMAADGATLSRLDTGARSPKMRGYYESAGYRFVGEASTVAKNFGVWHAALYEKTIG